MGVNQLLNLPEEQVIDQGRDVDQMILRLYSPLDDQSDDGNKGAMKDLPQIRPAEALAIL